MTFVEYIKKHLDGCEVFIYIEGMMDVNEEGNMRAVYGVLECHEDFLMVHTPDADNFIMVRYEDIVSVMTLEESDEPVVEEVDPLVAFERFWQAQRKNKEEN